MSRQAQVGAFALLALLLLFGVFYVITDFGTRHTGYRIGVHFQSAAGLHSGAIVYFSGVTVGTVDAIQLLPDNTVDVILAVDRDVDIPKASRFLIQAPLTGDPNLIIVPPRPIAGVVPEPLTRNVLPLPEQPQGTNTATIADLLEQGQGEIIKLDAMLSDLAKREPRLLDTMQDTLANADRLTRTAQSAISSMSSELQSSLAEASHNIVALTATLNDSAQMNKGHINAILANFDASSAALNASMGALKQMATNPDLKANVLSTTKSIADTTANIAGITRDLRNVTDDPQTQAQIKNTMANLDATMQRANSLLGGFGGTSSVYGVDTGATPFPMGTSGPVSPTSTYPPPPYAQPTANPLQIRSRLSAVAKQLISIQVRMSELNAQSVCCPNSLFTADKGPESDINAVVLPNAGTSLMFGANNIGHGTTANAALIQSLSQNVRFGGGVLYSQFGVLGQYNAKLFDLQAELFNPQRPQFDYTGGINLTPTLQLFAGERAANHEERRFTYGLQYKLP